MVNEHATWSVHLGDKLVGWVQLEQAEEPTRVRVGRFFAGPAYASIRPVFRLPAMLAEDPQSWRQYHRDRNALGLTVRDEKGTLVPAAVHILDRVDVIPESGLEIQLVPPSDSLDPERYGRMPVNARLRLRKLTLLGASLTYVCWLGCVLWSLPPTDGLHGFSLYSLLFLPYTLLIAGPIILVSAWVMTPLAGFCLRYTRLKPSLILIATLVGLEILLLTPHSALLSFLGAYLATLVALLLCHELFQVAPKPAPEAV